MRWKPSVEQLATAIDCAVARVPLERAAELLGVKPRTLKSFSRRIEAVRPEIGTKSEPISGKRQVPNE